MAQPEHKKITQNIIKKNGFIFRHPLMGGNAGHQKIARHKAGNQKIPFTRSSSLTICTACNFAKDCSLAQGIIEDRTPDNGQRF
jgi:hypothetical protein